MRDSLIYRNYTISHQSKQGLPCFIFYIFAHIVLLLCISNYSKKQNISPT